MSFKNFDLLNNVNQFGALLKQKIIISALKNKLNSYAKIISKGKHKKNAMQDFSLQRKNLHF